MKDGTREKLRNAVAMAQWSVSGIVVAAVMVLVLGVPVPEWLGWGASYYVALVGPASMISAMYLVWQLPGWDPRKLIVLAVELFILFAGVGLFHANVQRSKVANEQRVLEAFLARPEYVTAKDKYETAKKQWDAQVERIGKIPGDFTTGAKLTDAAAQKAKDDFDTASAAFIKAGEGAPKVSTDAGASTLFEIFGKENADATQAWVLFLLGLSFEGVALAVSWRPDELGKKTGDTTQKAPQAVPEQETGEDTEPEPKVKHTALEYVHAATQGRTDGKVSGRETVMQILGISEREARRLYAECIEKGYIIPTPKTSPKVAQLNGDHAQDSGVGSLQ